MASYVFDQVKRFVASGTLNFTNVNDGQYRVALVTEGAVSSTLSDKTRWSEISQYEINDPSNSNYNSEGYPGHSDAKPGNPLNGVNTIEMADAGEDCDDGLPDIKVYADNVNYNVSTIDAAGAVILRGRTDTDYDLITMLDLRNGGELVRSNNGVFQILLSNESGGFLIIK